MHNIIKITLVSFLVFVVGCKGPEVNSVSLDEEPSIYPAYTGITVPINIAPLNFRLTDTAEKCIAKFSFENSFEFEVSSRNGEVRIPMKQWKKALSQNGGSYYNVDLFTKRKGQWLKYKTIRNFIAKDSIDSYLVYRYINPANILWHDMAIHQRNLESFDVYPIMDNELTDQNCMNCHSFAANNSNHFMFHMRGKPGGTIIYSEGDLKFVDTKTEQTISAGGYPAWHPTGNYIAFSTNKIHQRFHAAKEKYAFVYDSKSDLILYDVKTNSVSAIPQLSSDEFENMPSWSPDGKYLYFLSALSHNPDTGSYLNIKYNIHRISFDEKTASFGEVEVVLDAISMNKSAAFPRVSKDNKYLAFCLAESGYFTVYNETANVNVIELESGKFLDHDLNTEFVESYPSWSKNGKWLMFNTKRDDGLCSRPYFAYVDDGEIHKPFVLPQKDPMWNFKELKNINRPELSKTRVPLTPQEILRLVSQNPEKATFNQESLKGMEIRTADSSLVEMNSSFDFDQ